MTPRKLTIRGFTRYVDECVLDLTELPPGLVALVGKNGSGKTTILDALAPAPIYREFPSYPGRLADVAVQHIRDASIDLEVEYGGHVYRHLVQVDPLHGGGRGKVEAYLYRDGVPLNEFGRQGDYRQEIAKIYPPQSVFLAAAYSSQIGTGNWFSLDLPGRRALFADLLALGDLAEIAGRSNTGRRQVDDLLGKLETQGEAVAVRVASLATYRTSRGFLADQLAIDEAASTKATADLAEEEEAEVRRQAAHERARSRWLELRQASWTAIEGATTARAALVRVRDLQGADRAIVEGAGDLDAKIVRLNALIAEKDTHGRDHLGLVTAQTSRQTAYTAAVEALGDAEITQQQARAGGMAFAGLDDAIARSLEAVGEVSRCRAEIAALAIEAGASVYPDPVAAVAEFRRQESGLARKLQAAHEEQRQGQRAAQLLGGVPCAGADYQDGDDLIACSECQFLGEATTAAAALEEIAESIPRLEKEHAEASTALEAAERSNEQRMARDRRKNTLTAEIARWEDSAGQLDAHRARVPERDAARAAYQDAKAAADEAREGKTAAARRRDGGARLVEVSTAEGATLAASIAGLLPARDAHREIAEARTRVASRLDELDRLTEASTKADATAEAAEEVVPVEPIRRSIADEVLARKRERAIETAGAVEATRQGLARIDGSIEALGDVAGDVSALKTRTDALARRRAGWVLLERAFGRDGVPALEIDAAGPEVSGLINDLLAEVFGRRFSVQLRTVRAAGAGKKQKEVFDLQVLDGARGGAARAASRFSVGERAIISEALKLALAIFVNRRQAHPIKTLWRDECDGALEEGVAAAYPAMLRAALKLGGYRNVFLISHRRTVWEQCDSRILIEGGRATLEIR